MRKSSTTLAFPPSITRVNDTFAITPGDAPMIASSCGAKIAPTTPIRSDSTHPNRITCAAVCAAPSASFSPIRRATIAPAPMLSPIASAYRIVMNDSVSPTVATASAPRCATTNTSTTTKMLSMSISSTIGTARMKIARPIGPSVKSRPCAPANASRTAPQSDCGGARSGTESNLSCWT